MAKSKTTLLERTMTTVIKALGDNITGRNFRLKTPALEDLDPGKFNRIELSCDDQDVTVSIFVPMPKAENAGETSIDVEDTQIGLPKQMTGPEDFPMPELPMKFEHDYRVSNPGLHKLYVGYALETILIAKKCVDDLQDLSRWPASHMAHLLWSEIGRTIVSDAAWFEAIALIGARIDLTPYLPEHSSPEVQEAVMRAQEG